MPPSPVKLAFISYRRGDSSPVARWLGEAIEQNFGRASLFIDTSAIQTGDEWPKSIERSLKKASALIAVIGPEWLKAQDRHNRRRIDAPNDWVRNEILHAIRNKLSIIPLLVLKAELPEREALPKELRPLLRHQAFELREEQWQVDVQQLLNRLEQLGFERIGGKVKYPEPRKNAQVLTDDEMRRILKRLHEWELVDDRVGPDGKKKVELMRAYEFVSFEDAIHFMSTATRHITNVDHHPDWENIWKTITVRLTTWDIGHKPSVYDVELAEYLDQLYQDYEPKEKATLPIRRKRATL